MSGPIVVIGGGIAGIAAALRLAEAGRRVTLVETKARLGGRATSFVDPRTGDTLDNCQHVLMGCFTNLLDLYDRLGVLDGIAWEETLHWARGHGTFDRMGPGPWPAPLHMAGAFLRSRLLEPGEKRAIRGALWSMMRLGARGIVTWRGRTFGAFLREHKQPEGAIARFWGPIIVGACNLHHDRVAAPYAFQVFRDGFLAGRWAATMGLSRVPLATLYDAAGPLLEAAGGTLALGTGARAIAFDGRRVTGVVTATGLLEATEVVAAVPFDRLARLAGAALTRVDARLQSLDRFEVSPILGVHLRMPRRVMDRPHAVLVDRPVHWFFDKGCDGAGRQLVHAVVSAADDWMDRAEPDIVARVLDDLHWAFPGSRGLEPESARTVKERRATFALTPEADALRPSAAPAWIGTTGGGVPNLFLAGDWCDTGWPATMEGAARSGYAAAASITGSGGVVDDVPKGWLARLLMRA